MKKRLLLGTALLSTIALVACGVGVSETTPVESTKPVETTATDTTVETTKPTEETPVDPSVIATYTGAGDFTMGGTTFDGTIKVELLSETELRYTGSFYVSQFQSTIERVFTADYQLVSIENDISNVLLISRDYNNTTMEGSDKEQAADVWAKFAHELCWQLNDDGTMDRLDAYYGDGQVTLAMGGTTYTGDLRVVLVDDKELLFDAYFFVPSFNMAIERIFTADYKIVSIENDISDVLLIDRDYNGTTMVASEKEQPADIWAKFSQQLAWQLDPTSHSLSGLKDYYGASQAKLTMGGVDYTGDLDVVLVDETECIYKAYFYVPQFGKAMERIFTADYTIAGDQLTIDEDYNGTTMVASEKEQPGDIWAKFADQKNYTINEAERTLTLNVVAE